MKPVAPIEVRQVALGMMFSKSRQKVLLIERTRKPGHWMHGRLCMVGGKVDAGETPHQAMVREFYEEVGIKTTADEWKLCAVLHLPPFEGQDGSPRTETYVYRAFGELVMAKKMPGEDPFKDWYVDQALINPRLFPNLRWLIPFALTENLNTPLIVDVAREHRYSKIDQSMFLHGEDQVAWPAGSA